MKTQSVSSTYLTSADFSHRRYNKIAKLSLSVFIIILILFGLTPASTKAEGSKELMADTSSRAALSTITGIFAGYNSTVKSRLYFHIKNPATESVFLGFSLGYSNGSSAILGEGSSSRPVYYFRIKDPAGNIVYGPKAIDASSAIPVGIAGFDQIKAGPAAVAGAAGYTGFNFIPGGSAPAGDYFIEFNTDSVIHSNSQCSFDYWDISVANISNPTHVLLPGRVWSYQWGLYSKDYPSGAAYSGVFKGQIYSYTSEGFVNKINFANSIFRGGSFQIGLNSTGPGSTGNVIADRQSIYNQRIVGDEYKLFFNNPDIEIYPTGNSTMPTLEMKNGASVPVYCNSAVIDVEFTLSRPGKIDILLDFNANEIYDAGTRDVILGLTGVTGENKAVWNRHDGLGDTVTDSQLSDVGIHLKYQIGVHHISLADVEYLTNSFTIEMVRPLLTPGYVSKFYWDDTRINTSTGLQVPYTTGPQPEVVNLTGSPERRWDNFVGNSTIGFGNSNSINTWWNSYQDYENTSFVAVGCAVLPVKLEKFTAIAKENNKVLLNWKIAAETDDLVFVIEHSKSTTDFKNLKTIKGTGDYEYNVTDNTAGSGPNYYRLKIIEKTGAITYSEIRKVNIENNTRIDVYPNPISKYLNIEFENATISKNSLIRIVSLQGNLIVQKQLVSPGLKETIDVSKLARGTYFLQVIMADGEKNVQAIDIK